ncbi:MAG: serine hydrolase [Chloroflexi bacterium]|nr:serine hydrolase [Chloroflexota bacterium]
MRCLRTLNHLAVVFLVIPMLLQACQQESLEPVPTSIIFQPSATTVATLSITATVPPATETPLPSATLTQPLEKQVEMALIEGVNWYVGIESADGEKLFARNTEESFFPSSLNNIPIAMVVLKILEYRGDSIEDIHAYGIGQNFNTLLERMVVENDPAATDTLVEFAEAYDRLRNYLNWWGLKHTFFYPRRTTVEDQLLALSQIDSGDLLNETFSNYLLQLMGIEAENEERHLSTLKEVLPECDFYNKSGTMGIPMTTPTVISETGVLKCGEQSWYIVIAGTPADPLVALEDIQASIEQFGLVFGNYLRQVILR